MNIKELRELIKKEDGIFELYDYIKSLEEANKSNKNLYDVLITEKDKEIDRLNQLLK